MTKNGSRVRLGVDIGGTFTDVVLEVDETLFSRKVLTTFLNPEDGILDGIKQVCGLAKIAPQHIQQVIHGTTLATNALIERNGAKTALVTTKGFRDVIEMRTESRFEQYDLNLKLPEPLIPRQQRYVVEERLDASGEILIPLKYHDVENLVEKLKDAKFESIAVGLIHSYRNSCHEEMLCRIITEKMPNVMVSLSSRVSPQMREYERFNTVCANAYVQPLIKNYLLRLQKKLIQQKVDCPIFLMHSGGGIISLEDAAEFPVRLIESGPAGGAVFAATISKKYNIKNTLSFDMGGTTAKICLIKNQKPKTSRVFEVARSYRFKKGSGMPISIPVIDMVEIGAGGGSLAYVDDLQQIRVGPQSSGSNPGPACYGLGGTSPAVTDADLLLGKLSENGFAGGSLALNRSKSEQALKLHICDKIPMNEKIAAHGVSEVVDENMANAARVHAVENGEDLADYTMVAFGGAAPLHASRICEKLNINAILIPEGAGVGSALGFLHAPFSFEATRSYYSTVSHLDSNSSKSLFSELENEARTFVESCDPGATVRSEFKLYMRYKGQGWEIPVHLRKADALESNATKLQKLFEKEYKKIFGRLVKGLEVEITIWSVNCFTPMKKVQEVKSLKTKTSLRIEQKRTMFDSKLNKSVNACVIQRNKLNKGDQIFGPAIITEDETTIILTSEFKATVQMDKCIRICKHNTK